MSVAEKLTTVAENMPKVFEAGQKLESNRFWDIYLNGTYFPYRFAGNGWNDNTFEPNKDVVPSGSAEGMFRQSKIVDLKGRLEACGVTLDLSKVTVATFLFGYADVLTSVPKINLSSAGSNTTYLFAYDGKLQTIEELTVSETTTFANSSFQGCSALTRLIMTGTLATNGLDLHWSTKLTKESLLSIIGVLQDKTSAGGTWTVTFGSTNLAKLTDAEKAVATQKGWTLV
jgi:hypothetical protein